MGRQGSAHTQRSQYYHMQQITCSLVDLNCLNRHSPVAKGCVYQRRFTAQPPKLHLVGNMRSYQGNRENSTSTRGKKKESRIQTGAQMIYSETHQPQKLTIYAHCLIQVNKLHYNKHNRRNSYQLESVGWHLNNFKTTKVI